MKTITHPEIGEFKLVRVLHALSDPMRLLLVRMLAEKRDLSCSDLCLGRPRSSMSHHFKVLIDAGLLQVDVEGNTHRNNLRLTDLESRFPGVITSIIRSETKDPRRAASDSLKTRRVSR